MEQTPRGVSGGLQDHRVRDQELIPLLVSHCILGQGSLDRSDHTLFDGIFIVKTNFLFGWVNIDIHKQGQLNEQATNRMHAFHEGRVVSFAQGKIQGLVLDRTTVDEQPLITACGSSDTRRTNISQMAMFSSSK